VVEIRNRATGESSEVPLAQAAEEIGRLVKDGR